jgi:hypothetical protein
MDVSLPVVKRLYAVSSNRCAFPMCSNAVIDPQTGSIVSIICHIRARNPGGPRYDTAQTDAQRNGFENLLLLCCIHSKIVDDHPEKFPVQLLSSMKSKHEAAHTKIDDLSDELAERLAGDQPNYEARRVLAERIENLAIQLGKSTAIASGVGGSDTNHIRLAANAERSGCLLAISRRKSEVEALFGTAYADRFGQHVARLQILMANQNGARADAVQHLAMSLASLVGGWASGKRLDDPIEGVSPI